MSICINTLIGTDHAGVYDKVFCIVFNGMIETRLKSGKTTLVKVLTQELHDILCNGVSYPVDVFTRSVYLGQVLGDAFPKASFRIIADVKMQPIKSGTPSPVFIDDMPSKIRENLYLGSYVHASSKEIFDKLKFDIIVNCTTNLPDVHNGVVYHRISLLDVESEKIEEHFEEAEKIISYALAKNLKVLVHCAAGISRSASLVISYIMKSEKKTFERALAQVKEIRPIVAPNIGFHMKLEEYEKTLMVFRY